MATQVGWIYVGIGVDVTQVEQGFSKATSMLRKFQGQMSSIKLEGIIKGDPFSVTRKYVDASQRQIDKVFRLWSDKILRVNKDYNKFAESSRTQTEQLIKDYGKVTNKLKAVQNVAGVISGKTSNKFWQSLGFGETAGGPKTRPISKWFPIQEDLKAFMGVFKSFSPKAKKIVDDFFTRFNNGIKTNSKNARIVLKDYFGKIKKELANITSEYAKFGERIRKAQMKMTGLKFGAELETARSSRAAINRRSEAVRKLRVEEARLNAEIRVGMNVSKNRAALARNYQKRQELGIKLTKSQARALKKLNKEIVAQRHKGGVFSKEWLKYRAGWFLQLRAYWEAYRLAGDAARDLAEFQNQLARAMRTATSEVKNQLEIAESYKDAMSGAARMTGAAWDESGEALYQLGSAGLSAEQNIAALNHVMALSIALESDVRETTKMVASIYNNFADSIKGATTQEEKFGRIVDAISGLFKNHQFEVHEMVDALKMSSASAKAVGLGFEDLIAILAVSHDHMLKTGRAGRMLRNIFVRMAETPELFAKAFDVEDIFDASKPIQFIELMTVLSKRFKTGALNADQLAAIFDRMGRRGADLFILILNHFDEILDAQKEVRESHGATFDLLETRLKHLGGAWKLFVGELRSALVEMSGIFDGIAKGINKITNLLARGRLRRVIDEFMHGTPITKEGLEELSPYTRKELSKEIEKQIKAEEELVKTVGAKFIGTETARRLGILRKIRNTLEEITKEEKEQARINKKKTDTAESNRKIAISEAEELYNWKYKERDELKKMIILQSKVVRINEEIVALEESLEGAKVYATRKRIAGELNKKAQEREKIEREILKIRKSWEDRARDRIKYEIDSLSLEKEYLNNTIQQLQAEQKRITSRRYTKNLTEEEAERLKELYAEINRLESKIANLNYKINRWKNEDVRLSKEAKNAEEEEADEKERTAKALLEERLIRQELATRENKLKEKLLEYDRRIFLKEKETAGTVLDRLNLAELEYEKLREQKEEYQEQLDIVKKGSEEELQIKLKLKKINIEILKNLYKQDRILHPLNDAWDKITDKFEEDVNELISDLIVRTITGVGEGLGGIAWDWASGFQDAKERGEELKGELDELEQEYKILSEHELLSQDDVDRMKEIEGEMQTLRDEIDRTESATENLKKAFRDWAKSFIDDIGRVITKWLAMELVMSAASWFAPSKTPKTTPKTTPSSMNLRGPANGTGGVIPQIQAFREFSSGGITGRPTLAVLGDNPSSKEIVIPEENIKSDEVSGYVRQSGDVYIANFLTEQDIATAMASKAGKNVVLNHIIQTKDKKGSTWRRI